MMDTRPDAGPRGTIGLFVGAALAVNALVFGMGGHRAAESGRTRLVPPGPVVGLVWTSLFGLMGYAQWRQAVDRRRKLVRPSGAALLACFCLVFPFYAVGSRSRIVPQAGTVGTLAVAIGAHAALRRRSPASARAVLPVIGWLGWVAFAGAIFGAHPPSK